MFDPWRQESWDANDTVLIPNPSADSDVGSFFSRLPKGDYLPTWLAIRNAGELGAGAVTAAQKATVHANTPSTVHFDALARAFLTIAFNRSQSDAAPPVELFYRTIMTFDIESNQRVITDTLGRAIVTYDYNLLNMRVRQTAQTPATVGCSTIQPESRCSAGIIATTWWNTNMTQQGALSVSGFKHGSSRERPPSSLRNARFTAKGSLTIKG